jgi:tRNA G10  N-methylase Trm11
LDDTISAQPSWKDRLIIHWKGEGVEGYSMQFRHWEFTGALEAVTGDGGDREAISSLTFHDALQYTGEAFMHEQKLIRFNQSMQYIDLAAINLSLAAYVRAAQRSSLVHAVYLACADADSYEDLAQVALQNGSFDDMRPGQRNEAAKWCVRVRHFGANSKETKERRHGERSRSITMEQEALKALKPLLLTFGGGVDLKKPDCKIYLFDGMKNERKVLARRVAVGPKTSIMAPATRICVTNTPLCPLAAYSMCNIAGIRPNQAILDPYAGSCAILLAAALIENSIKSVAIDIAHNGLVNRFDIRKDFTSRNVMPPLDLLRGDCADPTMRDLAREVTRGEPFDHIITDPPYGIRESTSFQQLTPIQELLQMISFDREKGSPLLKVGGKLVVFIPCSSDQTLHDVMPTNEELEEAGMVPLGLREQPLNENLSRWLVSFQCIR